MQIRSSSKMVNNCINSFDAVGDNCRRSVQRRRRQLAPGTQYAQIHVAHRRTYAYTHGVERVKAEIFFMG